MLSAYWDSWAKNKREDHLGRIRASGMEMTRTLDSILMVGRSDAGMLGLDPESLEMGTGNWRSNLSPATRRPPWMTPE